MVEAAFWRRTDSIVDLSVPLGVGLPCTWPGHAAFASTLQADFATGQAYRSASITMDEHAGTHVDAPSHSIDAAGDRTVRSIALGDLMGPLVVIDVPEGSLSAPPGRSPRVPASTLEDFERTHGVIEVGDVVLLRTGWDRRYALPPAGRAYLEGPLGGREPGWPAPDPAFVELLRERGVRCIGTDTPSIGALDDPGPVHLLTLGSGIWPIEALANLSALPPRGATFLFLPLALEGSGAPGRAIAFVPAEQGP